jgi:hypothetical protein
MRALRLLRGSHSSQLENPHYREEESGRKLLRSCGVGSYAYRQTDSYAKRQRLPLCQVEQGRCP